MEALWDLEDKLKVSTQGAIIVLAFVTFAAVCLCIVIMIKRRARNNKVVHQEVAIDENETTSHTEQSEPSCGWISVKRVLMGSMLCSRASKSEENTGCRRERASPLLGLQGHDLDIVWQSHNSVSNVAKTNTEGEKCELPSFSGLILYDEKGGLLPDFENETNCKETSKQDKTAVTRRTTLKYLL